MNTIIGLILIFSCIYTTLRFILHVLDVMRVGSNYKVRLFPGWQTVEIDKHLYKMSQLLALLYTLLYYWYN